jgi:PIN domain nuclease of toxin-antitoxin system
MSAFLLDTHTFIWLTENDSSLPDDLSLYGSTDMGMIFVEILMSRYFE